MTIDDLGERANQAVATFLQEMRGIAQEAQNTDKDELTRENERLRRNASRLRRERDVAYRKSVRILATLPDDHPAFKLDSRGGE